MRAEGQKEVTDSGGSQPETLAQTLHVARCHFGYERESQGRDKQFGYSEEEVVIFFWFSFHQNGTSLSLFARDFCVTDTIAPEIWQAVNPFFVIVLTPLIMLLFSTLSKKGIEISTPRKIAIGMGLAAVAYLFLMVISWVMDYPSAGTGCRMLTHRLRLRHCLPG